MESTPSGKEESSIPSHGLDGQVEYWTLVIQEAGRYLVALYRGLGDGKQAANAQMAMGKAEERVARLRLGAKAPTIRRQFLRDGMGETELEAAAWGALLEGQVGTWSFHALVPDDTGLAGARSAVDKALQRAVQGLRVAFPDALAQEICMGALERAVGAASTEFVHALGVEGNPEDVRGIREELLGHLRGEFQRMGIQGAQ